jgi:hypothetical protein
VCQPVATLGSHERPESVEFAVVGGWPGPNSAVIDASKLRRLTSRLTSGPSRPQQFLDQARPMRFRKQAAVEEADRVDRPRRPGVVAGQQLLRDRVSIVMRQDVVAVNATLARSVSKMLACSSIEYR